MEDLLVLGPHRHDVVARIADLVQLVQRGGLLDDQRRPTVHLNLRMALLNPTPDTCNLAKLSGRGAMATSQYS